MYTRVYVYRYVQSQCAFGEGVTDIYQKEWKDRKRNEIGSLVGCAVPRKKAFQKGRIDVIIYSFPLE